MKGASEVIGVRTRAWARSQAECQPRSTVTPCPHLPDSYREQGDVGQAPYSQSMQEAEELRYCQPGTLKEFP